MGEIRNASRSRAAGDKPHEQRLHTSARGGRECKFGSADDDTGRSRTRNTQAPNLGPSRQGGCLEGEDEHGGYADSGEKTDDAEGNREDPERGKLYLV